MIEKLAHYAFTNLPSVYDEEALTALELVARLAAKFNEVIEDVNDHEERVIRIEKFLKDELDTVISTTAVEIILEMAENGALDDMVSNSRIRPQLFGAKGDGETDDTFAMQTWIAFISENGYQGYIPNGTYLLSGMLRTDNTPHYAIQGESKTGVILKMAGDNLSCFAIYNSEYGCEIRNLTIDMNQTVEATSGIALYNSSSSNIVYEDIIIKNIGYGALLAYTDGNLAHTIKNMHINRVEIYGVGRNLDGVHPTGFLVASGENCHITNSYAENICYYPFEFKNFSTMCFVTDCTAKNCKQGFYLGGDAVFPSGREHYTEYVTFNNCTAIDCEIPFEIGAAKYISFINCQVYNPNTPTVNSTAMNIRNSKHVYCNGIFWFRYCGVDIRNCIDVSVNASIYRHEDKTTGDVFKLVAPLEKVYINILATNDEAMPTKRIIDGVIVNYANIRNINMSHTKRSFKLLGVNTPVSPDIDGANVVEAPILKNYYHSQEGNNVMDTYGTYKGARIEVDYKFVEGFIRIYFYDANNTLLGHHDITPGAGT